jgi:hypothetical protein
MTDRRYIHYPGSPTGQHGVNAHKDTGLVTLLLPDGPGLEIQLQVTGEWVPVETIPGAFVVNLGEILQSLTGQVSRCCCSLLLVPVAAAADVAVCVACWWWLLLLQSSMFVAPRRVSMRALCRLVART